MIGSKRKLRMKEEIVYWVSRKMELIQTPAGMITVVMGFVIGVMIGKSVL